MQYLKSRGAKSIVGISKRFFSSHKYYDYTLKDPSLKELIEKSTKNTVIIEGVKPSLDGGFRYMLNHKIKMHWTYHS